MSQSSFPDMVSCFRIRDADSRFRVLVYSRSFWIHVPDFGSGSSDSDSPFSVPCPICFGLPIAVPLQNAAFALEFRVRVLKHMLGEEGGFCRRVEHLLFVVFSRYFSNEMLKLE